MLLQIRLTMQASIKPELSGCAAEAALNVLQKNWDKLLKKNTLQKSLSPI